MHAAEVEKGHVERHACLEVFQGLAESERQPREAPKVSPHAQVGAFDMAGRNAERVGVSADGCWDSRNDVRRVVPLRPLGIGSAVHLNQLGEVHVRTEVFLDGRNVALESVRRDLESAHHAPAKIAHELVGACRVTFRSQIGQNKFRVAVDCHPHVSVSPLRRVSVAEMRFFGVNERPEFIGLDETRTHSAHAPVEKRTAVFPDRKQKREDRPLMRAREPRDGAHRHALKQHGEDPRGFFGADVVASKRPRSGSGKRSFTGGTAESLDSTASVKSKAPCFFVRASNAGHRLAFSAEQADNVFGSAFAARSAIADLALSVVDSYRQGTSFVPSLPPTKTRKCVFERRIVDVKRLASRIDPSSKSTPRLGEPGKRGVKNGERLRVAAQIHTELGEVFHDLIARKSSTGLGHQNVAAQIGKARSGSDTIFIGERLKHSDGLFQLDDPLIYELQLRSSLLKFLLGRQKTRFVRIDVNVCHGRDDICHV